MFCLSALGAVGMVISIASLLDLEGVHIIPLGFGAGWFFCELWK